MSDARYPWHDYARKHPPPYASQSEQKAWMKEHNSFSVTWIIPSDARLDYGWRSETRGFATREEALAAGQAKMGIAMSVEVFAWDWDEPVESKDRRVTIYRRKNAAYGKRRKS